MRSSRPEPGPTGPGRPAGELDPNPAGPPESTVRLATFNVRHGLGDDGRVDLDRFAAAVAALGADVLALQEVEVASPRSGRANLPAIAAGAIGADAWRFAPTLRWRWGRRHPATRPALRFLTRRGSFTRQGGPLPRQGGSFPKQGGPLPRQGAWPAPGKGPAQYGIALVSRFPVGRWWRLDLPREGRDEPRSALAARILTPSGALTVVATHLSVRPVANSGQLDTLVTRAAELPHPLVIAGDLNLSPQAARRPGWRPLATALTHPVARPIRQIDHLLTSGGVHPAGPGVAIDTGLSDHRALVVDVLLAGG